ncbi:CAAX protease self-immunity [Ruminococcaceae bacterium YRB3002]|nr:CAAX protease self-immunity [Ruminococcaceae bacterium YRB3002]
MDKKKVIKFIAITLAAAWILQSIVGVIANKLGGITGTIVFSAGMCVVMFIPAIAAFIAKADVKGMGWKPKFKGNVRWIFYALWMPALFSVLGLVIFFAFKPEIFSLDGSYALQQAASAAGMEEAEYLAKMEGSGLTIQMMIIVSVIQMFTYAPFINMVVALGEEIGWRGFLYPELRKKFGRVSTWLIGGAVWGAFHYPVILINGYEYGTDYIGAPFLGLLVFTVTCITWGIFLEVVYDKTKCIWFPALLHGALNAEANLFQYVLDGSRIDEIQKNFIFGPAPNGLISVIPAVIIAIIVAAIVLKDKSEKRT